MVVIEKYYLQKNEQEMVFSVRIKKMFNKTNWFCGKSINTVFWKSGEGGGGYLRCQKVPPTQTFHCVHYIWTFSSNLNLVILPKKNSTTVNLFLKNRKFNIRKLEFGIWKNKIWITFCLSQEDTWKFESLTFVWTIKQKNIWKLMLGSLVFKRFDIQKVWPSKVWPSKVGF